MNMNGRGLWKKQDATRGMELSVIDINPRNRVDRVSLVRLILTLGAYHPFCSISSAHPQVLDSLLIS